MINRTVACIRHIVWTVSVCLYATVLFIDYTRIWHIILLLQALVISFITMQNIRCPHCGRYKLNYNPLFSKEIGYCSACGERVEYKK
jgi:DNA-directed RNA polymerase subunit RPC12/RpoP